MSETDFIRKQQVYDTLRKKGLLMDQGEAFITPEGLGVAGKIAKNLFGSAPTAVTVQVDNGYMVIFSPAQTVARSNSRRPVLRHRGAPYPGGAVLASPEEEEKFAREEDERRHLIAVHALRMKPRVRVYPALSQAMDEIRKFYEADGVVPGIDFEKMADEVMDDIGDGSVLGV